MTSSSGRIDGVVIRYQKVHHDSRRFLCDSDSGGSTCALGSGNVLYVHTATRKKRSWWCLRCPSLWGRASGVVVPAKVA
jgi:hypothetical protein